MTLKFSVLDKILRFPNKTFTCLMIELYEPFKITTTQEKSQMHPSSLRQIEMFRTSETIRLSIEEILQTSRPSNGTRNL